MEVHDIMTRHVDVCTPDDSLQAVARQMVENDAGAIPIVQSNDSGKPLGIITDRDITCRLVARGINPLDVRVGEIMTPVVVTARPEMELKDCLDLMEKHQIRRIPVVDHTGRICGIVAQADIAKKARPAQTVELLKDVSVPAEQAQKPYH